MNRDFFKMGKLKWNVEKIKTECNNLGVELLSVEYIPKEKQLFKCNCGNSFERKFSNVLLGQIHCYNCRDKINRENKSKELKLNFEKFKNEVKDGDSCCEVLTDYTDYLSNKSKIKMRCKCGNIFYPTANNFKKGATQCKTCGYKQSGDKKRLEKDFMFDYVRSVGYNPISHRFHDKKNILIVDCKNKNHEQYEVNFLNFYHGKTRCPICNLSKGEEKVREVLTNHNIQFIREHSINGLKGINGRKLRFDFYLELNNEHIVIEYDGEQHFKPKFGEYEFDRTRRNDTIKNEYCSKNNIRLLRIPYKKFDNIEEIIKDFLNIGNTEITNKSKKILVS
jgi:very-short-patch-repair endonuclease